MPTGLTFEVVRSSVSVKSRRVLVTGGANGVGSHIVHRFLREGCQVAILDNDQEALEKFKMLLMAAWEGFDVDKMLFLHCDVSKEEQVKACITRIEQEFGGLDVLVNNAAIASEKGLDGIQKQKIEEWSTAEFTRYQEVNLIGTFIVTRECARLLEGSKGSIILLASIRAHRATEHQEAYSASKGGVISLARSLAASMANRGVRCNFISPGQIDVRDAQMADIDVFPGQVEVLKPEENAPTWIGRVGRGADVANVCYWLSSDEAAFVNGTDIAVDGGASQSRK